MVGSHRSILSLGRELGRFRDSALDRIVVHSATEPALRTAAGAHHYRFRGIEFATSATTSYVIVNLDGSATYPYPAYMTTLAEVPHHLILEQCYIHGTETGNISRGVQVNSGHTAVIDSHISDIHVVGADLIEQRTDSCEIKIIGLLESLAQIAVQCKVGSNLVSARQRKRRTRRQ